RMTHRPLTIYSLTIIATLLSGCWVEMKQPGGSNLDDDGTALPHDDELPGDGDGSIDENPGSGGHTGPGAGGTPDDSDPTNPVGTGGTSAASGGSSGLAPGEPTLPNGRGAVVQFVTYEAE